MHILFITSTRLGDAVLSTGLLDALLRRYPRADFTIACGPVAAGLFAHMPRRVRTLEMVKRRITGTGWICGGRAGGGNGICAWTCAVRWSVISCVWAGVMSCAGGAGLGCGWPISAGCSTLIRRPCR